MFDDDYDSDEEGEEERELSGDDRQFESLAPQLRKERERRETGNEWGGRGEWRLYGKHTRHARGLPSIYDVRVRIRGEWVTEKQANQG